MSLKSPAFPSAPLQQPSAKQSRLSDTYGPRESPPHDCRRDLSDGHLPATRIYVPPQSHSHHDRGRRSPPNRKYEQDSESWSSSQESIPLLPPPHWHRESKTSRHHRSQKDHGPVRDQGGYISTIKEETLADLPPWPSGLKLSLMAGNWLEWSRCLLRILVMAQLDEYPLGLLQRPDRRNDPHGHFYWNGNDRMIFAYMKHQMSLSEVQHVEMCATSAEAFQVLRVRHEKRSRFFQLQLIRKLMQISFDDDPANFDNAMETFRDLVYLIERIGPIDANYLGMFFLWLKLKTSHPAVHDALVPAFMNDSITVELMETRMLHYFDLRAFNQTFVPPFSLALLAQHPQRTNLCPNCKQPGHTIEFCVASGGKTEGLSMLTWQCQAPKASHQRTMPHGERSAQSSGASFKLDDDGTLWVGGVRYRPDDKTNAEPSELRLPTPDHGEFPDWPQSNSDSPPDTDTMLSTSTARSETALPSHSSELPFFLDSGSSSHISCMKSDFVNLTELSEPRTVRGVGDTSVYAMGVGTIELLLPETNARLQLHNALYAPDANVRLVSINELDRLGYTATFRAGHCRIADDNSSVVAICTPGPSNLYALPNAQTANAEAVPQTL